MAEFSLIKRMSNAYRAIIKREQKAAAVTDPPAFSGAPTWNDRAFDYRFRWSRNTQIDYRGEVGALDGHSLVACVFNYTGTRLPEARPIIKRTVNGAAEIEPDHLLAQLIQRPNKHHIWANYSQAASID